ncbi:hypothetical protein HDU85_007148 [Gaertneriomyces sp. JEL0708]|nr:hypothetical protein HDU85_007148 [Gaertneriomyces sp. JEL0708]
MSGEDFALLSVDYKSLRERKGHFSGGDHDADVDGYGGKKHRVMEKLAEALGKADTPATKVLEAMGNPDMIIPKIGASNVGPLQSAGPGAISDPPIDASGMPGPIIGGGSPADVNASGAGQSYFLVYYWRGRHDYLWFAVDGASEKVEGYGWYAAGD